MSELVEHLRESATDCCVPDGCCYAESMVKAADEIERLRARAERVHDVLRAIFWEGGIDQEDARKVHDILRGNDENAVEPIADRRTEQENAEDQNVAPCDDAEFGMKP